MTRAAVTVQDAMAWLELTLQVPAPSAGVVELCLETTEALAVTLSDAGDQPLLEPGVGETPLWREVTVTALYDADTERAPIESALRAIDTLNPSPELHWRALADRAWEREWLSRFQAQQFGRALWVVPGDQPPPDPAAVNVRLDPGLAFGTGDHATTRMCLTWLGDHAPFTGQRMLDFGCGSGILAIAALKLGAREAVALDNDPQVLTATRANAARNDVTAGLQVVGHEHPEKLGSFDLVLANILAAPLIELAPIIAAQVDRAGQLVLSGILCEQADDVIAAYQAQFEFAPKMIEGDWVCLHGRRSA